MIGYLRGKVIEKHVPEVWVDVSGVGYRVRVGERVYQSVVVDEEVFLYIHTAVRDDAIDLYGMADVAELQLFETVLGVSGIGPKIGLAIVGNRSVAQVEKAVREADVAFFQSIPGIGKKGAQRIIVDLKGKLGSLAELDLSDESENEDEVVEALVSFGFGRKDVLMVVAKLEGESVEERVREGLKRLGRR